MYDYQLCGWRVHSALRLPQLLPWAGDERRADLCFVEGAVPETFDDASRPYQWLTVGADGSVLLKIADWVRFLVQGGNRVTVQILREDSASAWRVYLLGVVLDYLCHQRGVFSLHASCVRVGDCALAIAGHSGAGKSTMALAMVQRGHGLLADDATIVRIGREGPAWVVPTFPALKLWGDSCRAHGLNTESLPRIRDELEKVSYALPEAFRPEPVRLRGLVVLGDGETLSLQTEPQNAALGSILGHVARPRVAQLLGREAGLFAEAALLSAQIEVVRMRRPKHYAQLPDCAALLEARFAQ